MRVAFGRSLGRSMTCSRQLFYEQRQRAGCRTMSLTETTPSRRLTWSTGRLSTKRCGAWVVKKTAECKHMCHPRGCFRRRLVLCPRSGLWGPSFQGCLIICSAKELGRMKISDQLCRVSPAIFTAVSDNSFARALGWCPAPGRLNIRRFPA